MRESRAELTFFDLRVSYGTAEMSVGCGTRATEIRGCDNLPLQVDFLLHPRAVLLDGLSIVVILAKNDLGFGEAELVHLLVEIEARAGLMQGRTTASVLHDKAPRLPQTNLDSPAGPESRLEACDQK